MNQETRNKLFKFGCIPTRIAIIVLIVLNAKNDLFRYIAAAYCFLTSIVFIIKYYRQDMIGGFGGVAWWASNRPKHALLFLATANLLLLDFNWAGYVLIADVLLGIYSYNVKETASDLEEFSNSIPAF